MNKYYYLEVPAKTDFDEEISSLAIDKYGCTGIEEFSIDEPRVDEILGERSYSGADLPLDVINEVDATVNVDSCFKKFYFSSSEQAHTFQNVLIEEYQLETNVIEKDEEDWNYEWKKNYSPIEVDQDLFIIPSWEKDEENREEKNKVFIYPGMGFGTGNHETTFLCLKSAQKYKTALPQKKSFLDFGCGSGILGIAVNKLYGIKGDLYDIDQDAINNCIQNIELNGLEMEDFKLLLPNGRGELKKTYDLVFANILQNVLMSEKEYLANSLDAGGVLILSGLLNGQEDEVIEAYQRANCELKHIETYSKGDWVAIEFRG